MVGYYCFKFLFFILYVISDGISTQYHISKYPTLKLFRNGHIVKKEYRGQRSVDALTEYIKGQVQDTVQKHSHLDELDELEVSLIFQNNNLQLIIHVATV